MLAAFWAEDCTNAVAVAPPGIELELQAALPALEGVNEDAFAVLRPDRAGLSCHDTLR
jgi:hypothetical protein